MKNNLLTSLALKQNEILDYNKNRITPFNFPSSPRVSIIIINKNGEALLTSLLESIFVNTIYSNFEIILVDNASIDNSVKSIEKWNSKLNIKIMQNNINKTFSKSNNDAISLCEGELILFLNNDTQVTYGWLQELVKTYTSTKDIGIAGGKLIYPISATSAESLRYSLKVQHAGVAFSIMGPYVLPYNTGYGLDPFHKDVETLTETLGITGAMLLINKKLFLDVGGFNENYIYGLEDIDLCLKLLQTKHKIYYTPYALAFHKESTTIKTEPNHVLHYNYNNNVKYFTQTWQNIITTNYLK